MTAPLTSASAGSGPIRVVVVDDDFAVAALHRSFVATDDRFEVVATVHSGVDALRSVAALAPDLVLLDVYLPDMTGLQVLTDLRAQRRALDVIVITAARELETVRSAMAGGVLHYLVKPFTAAELRVRLEDYLRHREVVRASAGERVLDQQQVDRLLGTVHRTGGAPGLPKGLSRRTLSAVEAALRTQASSVSAEEVAELVGMSRVAARRYLEHLVDVRRAHVEPRYGHAGRPQNLFRWLGGAP